MLKVLCNCCKCRLFWFIVVLRGLRLGFILVFCCGICYWSGGWLMILNLCCVICCWFVWVMVMWLCFWLVRLCLILVCVLFCWFIRWMVCLFWMVCVLLCLVICVVCVILRILWWWSIVSCWYGLWSVVFGLRYVFCLCGVNNWSYGFWVCGWLFCGWYCVGCCYYCWCVVVCVDWCGFFVLDIWIVYLCRLVGCGCSFCRNYVLVVWWSWFFVWCYLFGYSV